MTKGGPKMGLKDGVRLLAILMVMFFLNAPKVSQANTNEEEEFYRKQALSALDGTPPKEEPKASSDATDSQMVVTTVPVEASAGNTQQETSEVSQGEIVESEDLGSMAPSSELIEYQSQYSANASDSQVSPSGEEKITYSYDAGQGLQDAASTLGVSLISGVTQYPGVDNVENVIPLIGVGGRYNMGWGVNFSGEFMFAYHEIEVDRIFTTDIETVDDYIFGFDAGYDWMTLFNSGVGRFSVITGGVIQHRRRQYNLDENASRAWDAGPFVEAGYRINNRLTLAVKWRYLQNLSFEKDDASSSKDQVLQSAVNEGETLKLEELDSHFVMVSLSYLFFN